MEALVVVDVLQLNAALEVSARNARLSVDDVLVAAAAISESELPDHVFIWMQVIE